MTRPEQKKEELHWLKEYLRIAELDVSPINIQQQEQPDFMVKINDADVGVELTDYHIEGSRRQVEEYWNTLRRWPLHLIGFPKHRYVRLYFKRMRLPAKLEISQFVSEVISVTAQQSGGPMVMTINPDQYPILEKYVSQVKVEYAKPPYTHWIWSFELAWIGTTEEELIQILERKRSSAVSDAAAYWLMITTGGSLSRLMIFNNCSFLAIMTRLTQRLEQSPFERFILMQYPVIEWRRNRGWIDYQKTEVL